MSEPHTADELAQLLPGTWVVTASNFPLWLDRSRRDPRFHYGLVSANPLVLSDDVEYVTAAGETKHVIGTDRWRGDHFRWTGKGRLFFASSRWTIAGVGPERDVLVIRFAKTLLSPSGVDIIVREGARHDDVRARIAADAESYGVTPEEFGSLTWLQQFPGHA